MVNCAALNDRAACDAHEAGATAINVPSKLLDALDRHIQVWGCMSLPAAELARSCMGLQLAAAVMGHWEPACHAPTSPPSEQARCTRGHAARPLGKQEGGCPSAFPASSTPSPPQVHGYEPFLVHLST